ncbi:deoxycytidylate deaminase [Bradyrhizobium sp. HKCCYLS1011]|uniref:deoxycytidylate deaminase n=1 Tax=Bradyrhizobium sp. HKCCYLS1011 TaxID=3420733 RepID=UPI003EB911BD
MATSRRDLRLLQLCDEVRQSSHDPDRKVGAVVANAAGEVLAVGTNAPPAALGLTVAQSHAAIRQDPNWKYFLLEHAERNAIFEALNRGRALSGATMYGTLFPCADCARAIVASGLTRLVVLGPGLDTIRDQKWLDHYRHAQRIFELAGLTVEVVNPDELKSQDRN